MEGPTRLRGGPSAGPGSSTATCTSPSTTTAAWPCVEALDNETADTLCGFFERSRVWFRSIEIAIDEVIANNGPNFRSKKLAAQLTRQAIAPTFTCPHRPQTNAKAKRFNHTLTNEFLYTHKFKPEPNHPRRHQTRTHHNTHHHHHTTIGGTPTSHVYNLYGFYT